MTIPSVQFSLHGANLFLQSEQEEFLHAARLAFPDLVQESGKPEQAVAARLHWNGQPNSWKHPRVRRLGRRILQKEDSVFLYEVLPLPGLQLETCWRDGQLHIEAYYQPVKGISGWLRWQLGKESILTALSYYLVFFPLVHYLEQNRGMYLLHAAAVASPRGDYLLAGLPGSGKSTFSVAALDDPQARLVSDNLLLYDDHQVYALPETIHLSPESLQYILPAARQRLGETEHKQSYNRFGFHLNPEARAQVAQPQALFFIGLASPGGCQAVPHEQALERLLAMDSLAKETFAYTQFTAPLELAIPERGSSAARRNSLQALLQNLLPYELWLEPGDMSKERELVKQALANQDRIIV